MNANRTHLSLDYSAIHLSSVCLLMYKTGHGTIPMRDTYILGQRPHDKWGVVFHNHGYNGYIMHILLLYVEVCDLYITFIWYIYGHTHGHTYGFTSRQGCIDSILPFATCSCFIYNSTEGGRLNRRMSTYQCRICIIKISRSHDSLIFMMLFYLSDRKYIQQTMLP